MTERKTITLEQFRQEMTLRGGDRRGISYLTSEKKRNWERCLGAVAAALTAPAVGLLATAVIAKDGRPWMYDLGRDNLPEELVEALAQQGLAVSIPKIRTLERDAQKKEKRILQKMTLGQNEGHDPRRIPGMEWVRKSRLDEIPQFWAVAKGKLGVVGHRELTRGEDEKERKRNPVRPEYEVYRLLTKLSGVLPGMTGAYFLLGDKQTPMNVRFEGEIIYFLNATPAGDLWIVWETIRQMWSLEKAVAREGVERVRARYLQRTKKTED